MPKEITKEVAQIIKARLENRFGCEIKEELKTFNDFNHYWSMCYPHGLGEFIKSLETGVRPPAKYAREYIIRLERLVRHSGMETDEIGTFWVNRDYDLRNDGPYVEEFSGFDYFYIPAGCFLKDGNLIADMYGDVAPVFTKIVNGIPIPYMVDRAGKTYDLAPAVMADIFPNMKIRVWARDGKSKVYKPKPKRPGAEDTLFGSYQTDKRILRYFRELIYADRSSRRNIITLLLKKRAEFYDSKRYMTSESIETYHRILTGVE